MLNTTSVSMLILDGLASDLNAPHDPQDTQECSDVHLVNSSDRCEFVRLTSSCLEGGLVQYTEVVYCTFTDATILLATTLLVGWLLFLFLAMGICTDDFFCPPLVVLAKKLRMSDNIAGVTLLAFGNGAADVFSALAAVKSSKNGDFGLAIGALLGAGMFIVTVVAGSVCLCAPLFKLSERPFLRDVTFFIAAVFAAYVSLTRNMIGVIDAIVYLVLYGVFVAVVVVGRIIYQNQSQTPIFVIEKEVPPNPNEDSERQSLLVPGATYGAAEVGEPQQNTGSVQLPPEDEPANESKVVFEGQGYPTFLSEIKPFTCEQLKISRWYQRAYLIIKTPIMVVLRLCLPIVDFEVPLNGWCRQLNTIQCLTCPMTTILLASPQVFLGNVGRCPVAVIVAVFSLVLTLTVWFTSKNDTAPVYHMVFALVGFLASMVWVQTIAGEIVGILQTIGVVFSISNALLGLTLLAWGNCLSDLIADIAITRRGFPKTGMTACYAGPMFNILIGLGLPFMIENIKGSVTHVHFRPLEQVLTYSLLTTLVLTLVLVPVQKFQPKKWFPVLLFVLYVVFLILVTLTEKKVILRQ